MSLLFGVQCISINGNSNALSHVAYHISHLIENYIINKYLGNQGRIQDIKKGGGQSQGALCAKHMC